jgi:hypothetical protein
MTDHRNSTDAQDADDLRRSFMLALNDSLKTGEKVAAGTLEVVRKYLADVDAERRWQVEQAALVAAAPGATAPTTSGATSEATGASTAQTPSHLPGGMPIDSLPFRVSRRGVEVPPTKAADEGNEPTTWQGLSQVPFMTPND